MPFSKAARPRRSGVYVNYEIAEATVIPTSQGSVIALPFRHSWGPANVFVPCNNWPQFLEKFGDLPSEGHDAALQAFKGEGLPNRGGAGQVLGYRMAGASVKAASKKLQNTTPADALTLTAVHPGTRGNDLRVTVQDSASNALNSELIILDGATELERYVFADADIAGVAATINATSQWVTAVANISGVALGPVSSQALTAGDDGDAITGADWTAFEAALEVERFGIVAPANLTDDAIRTSLVAWSKARNASGRRHMLVVGGALGETAGDAIARSQEINDPNVLNIGIGSVIDDDLGELSTAQLVPRIAGILAARGESKSLTMARLAGVSAIRGGATASQIDQCYRTGTLVLARDTVLAAPVYIEKGLTTYATETDEKIPVKVFSNPKWVRTMHGIENESIALGAQPGVIGELPVNDKTRNFLKGEITAVILQPREDSNVLQAGWSIDVDHDPPPSDDDEFLAYRIGLKFGRTAEQIFLTVVAG